MSKNLKTKTFFFIALMGFSFIACEDEETTEVVLQEISLNTSEFQMGLQEVQQLVVSTTPEGATSPRVTWSSSNPEVAIVQASETGLVAGIQAVGTGTATITAAMEGTEQGQNVQVTVQRMYCEASGTGEYNPQTVRTSGGSTNLDHDVIQPEGNYNFYSDEVLTVNAGGSFTIEVVQTNNWSRTMIWIDWDGDGNFNASGEQVQVFGAGSQLNDGPFSATINVPSNLAKGAVRMRVVTGDAWTYDQIPTSVCGELANSTTKDFTVELQ